MQTITRGDFHKCFEHLSFSILHIEAGSPERFDPLSCAKKRLRFLTEPPRRVRKPLQRNMAAVPLTLTGLHMRRPRIQVVSPPGTRNKKNDQIPSRPIVLRFGLVVLLRMLTFVGELEVVFVLDNMHVSHVVAVVFLSQIRYQLANSSSKWTLEVVVVFVGWH
jgi:hypothetical protein